MLIESKQNKRVKNWRKLHKKKYRDQEGLFLIEGWHLIEEAMKSDWMIDELIVLEGIEYPESWDSYNLTFVTKPVFNEIAQTESQQGVLAVVKQQIHGEQKLGQKLLLVDTVQDPGNVGTIIRSALAFNADAVILGQGSVDLYNDKVVRATQGGLFHVPVINGGDLSQWITHCHTHNINIYATALDDQAMPLQDVEPNGTYAIIVGNEGEGVDSGLINEANETVYIPIAHESESLNVGVATSIVLYHFSQAT
ncbi:TrmH family RNA methyltransferase [Alkalibacillus filiformis]|uniref:TrmH family RNA methyltransferase n=1 Tax=Alkalibacillus filiformis TaxID=200990 RepID=A0ABU0DSA8_9BACI|nr:RNA methyltransferase [Alkalibacillus filiformis]MDQ0351208.1 TrmH family RNA methyltransferase [Alkalibacillus filiformis]